MKEIKRNSPEWTLREINKILNSIDSEKEKFDKEIKEHNVHFKIGQIKALLKMSKIEFNYD